MTEFQDWPDVYSHGEDIFDFEDVRQSMAIADVHRLAPDLEDYYSEFVKIREQRIVATIQIRADREGVEIQGKVPLGMEWFVADGDVLKFIACNDELLKTPEYQNSRAVMLSTPPTIAWVASSCASRTLWTYPGQGPIQGP
jgi:hypothetical protein